MVNVQSILRRLEVPQKEEEAEVWEQNKWVCLVDLVTLSLSTPISAIHLSAIRLHCLLEPS